MLIPASFSNPRENPISQCLVLDFSFNFQALLLPGHQPAWGGRGFLHHGCHWGETVREKGEGIWSWLCEEIDIDDKCHQCGDSELEREEGTQIRSTMVVSAMNIQSGEHTQRPWEGNNEEVTIHSVRLQDHIWLWQVVAVRWVNTIVCVALYGIGKGSFLAKEGHLNFF